METRPGPAPISSILAPRRLSSSVCSSKYWHNTMAWKTFTLVTGCWKPETPVPTASEILEDMFTVSAFWGVHRNQSTRAVAGFDLWNMKVATCIKGTRDTNLLKGWYLKTLDQPPGGRTAQVFQKQESRGRRTAAPRPGQVASVLHLLEDRWALNPPTPPSWAQQPAGCPPLPTPRPCLIPWTAGSHFILINSSKRHSGRTALPRL